MNVGDIVLTKDHFVGVVRYVGPVNGLSKDDWDKYYGIEIQLKRDPHSYGNTTGHPYFQTSPNNGLFLQQRDIIRKFPPMQLLKFIQIAQTHIPPQIVNEYFFPQITNDGSVHNKNIKNNYNQQDNYNNYKHQNNDNDINYNNNNNNQNHQNINININNNNNNNSSDTADLHRLRGRLSVTMQANEVSTLITFCENEGYDDLETIECDIDEYDIKENSSIIVDHMKEQYNWTENKQQQFVHNISKALQNEDNPSNIPNVSNISNQYIKYEQKSPPQQPIQSAHSTHNNQSNKHITTSVSPPSKPIVSSTSNMNPPHDLPNIYAFKIPFDIVKGKDARNWRDIIACFKRNKISNEYTNSLRKLLRDNNINTFYQIQNSNIFSHNPQLQILQKYIDKCIYELSPLELLPRNIEKKDVNECKDILDEQCAGLIKHDKPLIHFILLTQLTSPELPSEIVDIADRIYLERKRKISHKEFSGKRFFKNIDIKQKSKVALGLTNYHHRFLPEFPLRPIKYVVDKISGYQKYCILLSHITYNICNHNQQHKHNNSNTNTSFFNFNFTQGWSVEHKNNNEQKQTENGDADGCLPFMIDMMIIPPGCQDRVEDLSYDAKGPHNLDDIAAKLHACNISFETTQGLKGKYNNFDEGIGRRIAKQIVNAIRKLTNNFGISHQRICIVVDRRWRINCVNEWIGYDRLKKSAAKYNLNENWYKQNSDTIYVYSPQLKNTKRTYHEFKHNYIHETLLYLTKKCILPSRDGKHIGSDTPDGWLFNISAHVERSIRPKFYEYNMRWYIFLQGAAVRFFPIDMVKLWINYFAHYDEDKERMDMEKINKQFKIDLTESDSSYKRWYCAIQRSD